MKVQAIITEAQITFDACGNVCELSFADARATSQKRRNHASRTHISRTEHTKRKEAAITELMEYCDGKRKAFTIPHTVRGSPFALRVWKALAAIDYGRRVSYSDIARNIGAPRATRAVAHAIARNPVPIIIPCHRVVRSNGEIGEYALHTLGTHGRIIKEYLLNLESRK